MIHHGRVMLAMLLMAAPAAGQVESASPMAGTGITVVGVGEIEAKPNRLEIATRATGAAEVSGDAIVKYRDSLRRVVEAFDGLQLKQVTVAEEGFGVGSSNDAMQRMYYGGMPNQNVKPRVEIDGKLRIALEPIRDLPKDELLELIARLLDTAKDAGAELGMSQQEIQMAYRYGRQFETSLVNFYITDLDALREQAYERAIADARRRAERLAKLCEVKLERVMAVDELFVAGEELPNTSYSYPGQRPAGKSDTSRMLAERFAAAPVRVKLRVRYSIAPAARDSEPSK